MARRGGHKARNMSVQDERQMRTRGKMLRATAHHYTPPRGTFDEIAQILWEGYEADRLREQILADTLLYRQANRPAYYDGSAVPAQIRTFPDEIYLKREHLGPDLVENSNILDLNASKINAGTLADARIPQFSPTKLNRRLNLGGANPEIDVHSYPLDKAAGNLGWNQVGTPKNPIPKFARASAMNKLEQRVKKLEQKKK